MKDKAREVVKEYQLKGRVVEVRGEDVPLVVLELLNNNINVLGITGEDLFREFLFENRDVKIGILKRFSWLDESYLFKKPALCLLGPKNKKLESLGKKLKVCINKKYKELAKKYCTNILENEGYKLEKIYASGATEEFFNQGIVDIVIDIVCSGKSAKEYNLEVYDKLFESDIVILGRKDET